MLIMTQIGFLICSQMKCRKPDRKIYEIALEVTGKTSAEGEADNTGE